MIWYRPATVVVMLAIAVPAAAVQPPQRAVVDGRRGTTSAERWVRQLASDIEHLQEDLHYERGTYPEQLREQAEQASRAVAHFHRVLRQSDDREHVMRDFEEMDRQIHQLVDRINQSTDRWLRRQASRIQYADEQLHYALRTRQAEGPGGMQDLVARQAHLLESQARELQMLVQRGTRQDGGVRDAVDAFADEAEHFHEVVERGADIEHLRDDFRELDESWHRVAELLNRSSYSFYVRRRAQDVNRVHNQLHGIMETGGTPRGDHPGGRDGIDRRGRPSIQFEIPGVGRFRIPS